MNLSHLLHFLGLLLTTGATLLGVFLALGLAFPRSRARHLLWQFGDWLVHLGERFGKIGKSR